MWKGHGCDRFVQRIDMFAGMDDVEMVERKVLLGDAHGFGGGRLLRELELESETAPRVKQQQVEFGAAVRSPKIGVAVAAHAQDLLQTKPFPRCPPFRVRLQAIGVDDAKQSMEQT